MLYEVITVTSNTSGIAISQMMKGRSEEFRRHFLVTHFFNPVRYMKLLELVPGKDTDPEILVITSYSIHYTKLYE